MARASTSQAIRVRRYTQMLVAILGGITLTFFELIRASPGDPQFKDVRAMLYAEQLARLRTWLGNCSNTSLFLCTGTSADDSA